jgi:predicted transposase YdaD
MPPMGQKDIISKGILQRLLLDMAVYLFRLDLIDAELLATEAQRIEDRRADLVAKVTPARGDPFILHLEIQNANDGQMAVRMLRYLTDIHLAYPGHRLHQCLVYIGAERLSMASGLDSPQLRYHYDVVDMRTIDYRTLYASDQPDALVLAILGDFGDDDPQAVVVRLLEKLRRLTEPDEGRLRECLSMLEILADNRHLNVNIQEAYAMLQIDIERLPSYQKGLEKGLEQGMEKGMEKGMEQGIEQGLEEGEHRKALAVAWELLAMNFSPEQVAAITQLPLAEIPKK